MNNWGNESWMVPMMGIGQGPAFPGPNMGQGAAFPNVGPMGPGPVFRGPPVPNIQPMLPTQMPPAPPSSGSSGPPLLPPPFLTNNWTQGKQNQGSIENSNYLCSNKAANIVPDNKNGNQRLSHGINREAGEKSSSRQEWDTDRADKWQHQTQYNRNRMETNNKNDKSSKERREKRQRWTNADDATDKIMTDKNMIPRGNMPNHLPMDPMANMPRMPNMMSNMLMMQPLYFSKGILLPPLPNTAMPERRERPNYCCTIFVHGLPNDIEEHVVKEIFQGCGPIEAVEMHNGTCRVRFQHQESVEASFILTGYRYRLHNQNDNEAIPIFVDYSVNNDDQNDYESQSKRKREVTPPRIEPFTSSNLSAITEKIKSDTDFSEAAPTLVGWLERGECNKRNVSSFYSLIQASNNQMRRLYGEKMSLDEQFQNMKATLKEKYAKIILQFEQVGKILRAAKLQRVSDHFSKQQRRNIDMWLKMNEDVENIKEEFNALFEDDDADDKKAKGAVLLKKYENLKTDYTNLQYELEGYKNEAHVAKQEAEIKFEKFKAHFIAQQALQSSNSGKEKPILFNHPIPSEPLLTDSKTNASSPCMIAADAKLISLITAFLLVHPLGATLDYIVSYIQSIVPAVTHSSVHNILQKYTDVFALQTSGVGANIENKWIYVAYDIIKKEQTKKET